VRHFIKQLDAWSSGPLVVMAFYEEYTGNSLVAYEDDADFHVQMETARQTLMDMYFGSLASAIELGRLDDDRRAPRAAAAAAGSPSMELPPTFIGDRRGCAFREIDLRSLSSR